MNTKQVTAETVNKVNDITPSVIALARVLGVKPADFATALFAVDANDDFRAEIAVRAIKPAIDTAREADKKDC